MSQVRAMRYTLERVRGLDTISVTGIYVTT
jgi:monomeric isocitrate dehydrogenase